MSGDVVATMFEAEVEVEVVDGVDMLLLCIPRELWEAEEMLDRAVTLEASALCLSLQSCWVSADVSVQMSTVASNAAVNAVTVSKAQLTRLRWWPRSRRSGRVSVLSV
jgi:hypothetical protein